MLPNHIVIGSLLLFAEDGGQDITSHSKLLVKLKKYEICEALY